MMAIRIYYERISIYKPSTEELNMTIAVGDSLPEVELRMMLDHYQQTKNLLVRYSENKHEFFLTNQRSLTYLDLSTRVGSTDAANELIRKRDGCLINFDTESITHWCVVTKVVAKADFGTPLSIRIREL